MTPEHEEPCDHEWHYEAGDWSVGIEAAWVCSKCGQTDTDTEPPTYDDDY